MQARDESQCWGTWASCLVSLCLTFPSSEWRLTLSDVRAKRVSETGLAGAFVYVVGPTCRCREMAPSRTQAKQLLLVTERPALPCPGQPSAVLLDLQTALQPISKAQEQSGCFICQGP